MYIIQFAIGWWLLTDAAAQASATNDPQGMEFQYLLVDIIAVIPIYLINSFKWTDISNPIDEGAGNRAKCALMISFFISFGTLIGAFWIMIEVWGSNGTAQSTWPGVALVTIKTPHFISSF